MSQKKTIGCMLAVFLMVSTSFSVIATTSPNTIHPSNPSTISMEKKSFNVKSSMVTANTPTAIAVSDANPFFALIATPIAVHYTPTGEQQVIPLYVKNFDDPSSAVQRAEQQTGRYANFIIDNIFTPKEISLGAAEFFWQSSNTVLLIKEDTEGYNLGVVATPLASYLTIPIIVTDSFDTDVIDVLHTLGVQNIYLCGNLQIRDGDEWNIIPFHSVNEIIDECISVLHDNFNKDVNYITLANPLDITEPQVLDTVSYDYDGTISSVAVLPSQSLGTLINGIYGLHNFTIPADYKYCRIKIDVKNLEIQNIESLGDRANFMLLNPDGIRILYGGTAGGIATRDDHGNILEDTLHMETVIYDRPGTYTLQMYGQWFASTKGSYQTTVTLEKMDSALVPLMNNLSSLAPYLTAYHAGVIFAKPEFAFAANDTTLYQGHPCPGVSQPGTNWNLTVSSNEHTLLIHDQLNALLAQIANIDVNDLETLKNHYTQHPLYIAITADPTMVPMYFYKNPDGMGDNAAEYIMGLALPSDFMYGDIDPNPGDAENNTYTYWPFMENIVGRVTGRDVQDCSALIDRTIYYNDIINTMGDWKNTALVQTGCGLEFQNLPIMTRISHLIYAGRGEPTKFPTGESSFINMRLADEMKKGYTIVKNTFHLQSQREGFTSAELKLIKDAGLLNRLMFPAKLIELLDSDKKVTGGQDQLSSSFTFTFAHGSYNIFEHGDVFMDSRGFPFVTTFSRIYPSFRSGLSAKGTYDLRSVENMTYGPGLIFVESCITARTDGILAKNVLNQAFIHAGVNAYIGSTRVTADPGYLEPRPLPGGWGIGILGLMKATFDLKIKGKYPTLHFGAVIAGDFIDDLIKNNSDVGTALRNAKNKYLAKDANATFLWTPPLTFTTGCPLIDQTYCNSFINPQKTAGEERSRVLDKKYVALHEFAIYGDPMFNPYQSMN